MPIRNVALLLMKIDGSSCGLSVLLATEICKQHFEEEPILPGPANVGVVSPV